MDSHRPRKTYPIIPDGEHRCVWMDAGLLAFQICDHPSDCDRCPLDAAMRRQYSHASSSADHLSIAVPSGVPESLRDEYGYHTSHCWQKQHGTAIRIGIEPGLASALLVPKSVVLPTPGQKLKTGQPCVWIIMEDGTFPINAPADGEVTVQNSSVTREPQEVFLHPYERGWLFEFLPESEPEHVMDCHRAAECYRQDAVRFQESLDRALHADNAEVGATMADGGRPLQHVSSILGAKKYCTLVREAFGGKMT